MRVLGINAIYHDPAAGLVVDGRIVAAAEEERFSRRKHGKRPVPFAAWELPELPPRWCLAAGRPGPDELDAVAYSFDPALTCPPRSSALYDPWDHLRQDVRRAAPELPRPRAARAWTRRRSAIVQHHVAHAASAGAGRAVRAPNARCSSSTAAASGTATWPGATSTASWRSWPLRSCRTRSA